MSRTNNQSMNNTQLTSHENYDTSRMIFSEPIIGSIPDSKPVITFSRININTRNLDGSLGELILQMEPNLYSFGVSENTSQETGKINGYSLPIVLFNRDGPTSLQEKWVETFDNICERCKDHVMSIKEDIGKYDLERSDLKKFNSLYYKRDKGKIVPGSSPTLYAKLIVSKKKNEIKTMFFDYENNPLNPLDLIGRTGNVNTAIKIESIFIGKNISLQVKLYECEFRTSETGMRRLLSRPQANTRILIQNDTSSSVNPLVDAISRMNISERTTGENEDDEVGSLNGEEEAPIKKKLVRKVKKVVRDNANE